MKDQMRNTADYLKDISLGDAQTYKNLAIIPLFGPNSRLDYLVFDEAVNQGLQVMETETVARLKVKNETGKRIMVMQGEYVVGGKQNRMFAQHMFLAPGYEGLVPVNCVQQNRWDARYGGFSSSGQRATMAVRRATSAGQPEVWREVQQFTAARRVTSATSNFDEAYDQRRKDIEEYTGKYTCLDTAVGIIAASLHQDKKVYGIDVFDKSQTLQKNFKKLVDSYILEAIIGGKEIKPLQEEVREFISDLGTVSVTKKQSLSLGEEALLLGNTTEGVVLEFEGLPLYLNAGSKTEKRAQTSSGGIHTGFSRRTVSVRG